MASRYIALLALGIVLLSMIGIASAEGTYVLHIKWKDPWHIETISIEKGEQWSDNNGGRYIASSGGLDTRGFRHSHSLRFNREVRIPVNFIHGWISFRDTRLQDFDGSYERLWGLQGGAWSSSKGYCYWGYIVYGADGIHKVKLLKRIGRADAGAAFAVLAYHPGPRPLASYYSVRIEAGPPSGARGYWRYATLISISIDNDEQHNSTVVLCGGDNIEIRLLVDNAVKDTVVVHMPSPDDVAHPAAHLPSNRAMVAAVAAGLGLALLVIVFVAPRGGRR